MSAPKIPSVLVNGAPPKLAIPKKPPVIEMFPEASTVIPKAVSSEVPPKVCTHNRVPVELYLARKTSDPPKVVLEIVPKFTVPLKFPATTTFP